MNEKNTFQLIAGIKKNIENIIKENNEILKLRRQVPNQKIEHIEVRSNSNKIKDAIDSAIKYIEKNKIKKELKTLDQDLLFMCFIFLSSVINLIYVSIDNYIVQKNSFYFLISKLMIFCFFILFQCFVLNIVAKLQHKINSIKLDLKYEMFKWM
ncbi:MAG: hypothetical protein ACTSYH_03630 [Candidatus Heimdallarchaeaceae archaeon]